MHVAPSQSVYSVRALIHTHRFTCIHIYVDMVAFEKGKLRSSFLAGKHKTKRDKCVLRHYIATGITRIEGQEARAGVCFSGSKWIHILM